MGVGVRGEQVRVLRWHRLTRKMGTKCAYCHCQLTPTNTTIDHVLPKSKHPELAHKRSNMVLACFDCNNAKGDRVHEVSK